MPFYTYTTEDSKLSQDLFYHMTDEKPQEFVDEFNVKWVRDWGASRVQGVVDGKINAYSKSAFVEKTGKMKGNIGNLMDLSKELSQKRAKESDTGKDPVAVAARENWSKERGGRRFPDKPDPNLTIEI
mgnify:CR=1 FL=1